MAPRFTVGQAVRYKPGFGTYGYEDSIETDGRFSGVIVGFTAQRVKVELTLTIAGRTVRKVRTVDAASLILDAHGGGLT